MFDYLAAGATATDTVTYTIADATAPNLPPPPKSPSLASTMLPVFSGTAARNAFAVNGCEVVVATNVAASDVDSENYNGGCALTATVTQDGHQGDDAVDRKLSKFIWVDGQYGAC